MGYSSGSSALVFDLSGAIDTARHASETDTLVFHSELEASTITVSAEFYVIPAEEAE